jgi:hypothetical protein
MQFNPAVAQVAGGCTTTVGGGKVLQTQGLEEGAVKEQEVEKSPPHNNGFGGQTLAVYSHCPVPELHPTRFWH